MHGTTLESWDRVQAPGCPGLELRNRAALVYLTSLSSADTSVKWESSSPPPRLAQSLDGLVGIYPAHDAKAGREGALVSFSSLFVSRERGPSRGG